MCMWIIPLPLLVRVVRLWVGKAEGDHREYLQAKCLPSCKAQVQRQHGNCWRKTLYRYKAISAHMWRCYIMAEQVASAFVTNFHYRLKRPLIPTTRPHLRP